MKQVKMHAPDERSHQQCQVKEKVHIRKADGRNMGKSTEYEWHEEHHQHSLTRKDWQMPSSY